jgi:hypothetical protein
MPAVAGAPAGLQQWKRLEPSERRVLVVGSVLPVDRATIYKACFISSHIDWLFF